MRRWGKEGESVNRAYRVGRHHRRSIRLREYDYSQPGAYFVTICTHGRVHLFGEVVGGEMHLSPWGEIVREEWFRTAEIRANVLLYDHEFVVMPNHIHGIVRIVDVPVVGAQRRCAPTNSNRPHVDPGSLGAIVRSFKSIVTRRINRLRGTIGAPVWQRDYYEHIIRNERTLEIIRRYIVYNPLRWHLDRYNESSTARDPLAEEIWAAMEEDARNDPRAENAPKLGR